MREKAYAISQWALSSWGIGGGGMNIFYDIGIGDHLICILSIKLSKNFSRNI